MQVRLDRIAATLALVAALCLPGAPAPAQQTAGEVTVSHGISPFGELKYPKDFAHFDHVNPDAPKGGWLSFRGTAASKTFDSLNALILRGEAAQGLGRLYDSLLIPADDEPGAHYGLIAETLEFPADRSWVVFNLRPEARFSDGAPITADDVVFTIETLQTKGDPYYQIALEGVAAVEALDSHKVRVTFAEGVPTRDLPTEVGTMPIIPKHYYDTVDFESPTLVPPVGSGQFVVDRFDPARSITYCRNPDYWGKDLPVNIGAHNFDCVTYEYFADNTAAFEALKVGVYLFHEEYTSAIWATGYDFPAVSNGWVVREELEDKRPNGTQGFWMNLRREKFQDPRVREAIAMMFNFEWSNKTLFHGLYERTDSFWENSPMQAEGLPSEAELALLEPYRDQLPPEVFTEPAFVPPPGGPQQTDRTALRNASRLLDEAGWTVGADGMRRNAAGERLVVELLDDNPSFQRVAIPYIDNLRQVGIDARHTLIDAAQMEQRQDDFNYDMLPGRLPMSMSPSIELRTFFGSQGAAAPGTLNFSGLAHPVVDALIEEVVGAKSRDELEIRVRALDRVMRALQIWVPNWSKGTHWVAYWDVFGKPDKKPDFARGDDYWWFDQAKYQRLQAAGALR